MKPYLTPRQLQVVRLISLGCTNDQMAAILGISRSTVDNFRHEAKEKFGTDKIALLTRLAIMHGFTSQDDKLTESEQLKSGRSGDGWN